jgi:hypothetical protein
VNWTTPASSTFTGPTNLAVSSYAEAGGGGTCIPQSGTTQQLDSLADRMMYRLQYRNFGNHESLVTNHSVTAGSATGVRWYEIRSPNASPTVYQQGTYAPDAAYRWMGSAAMDGAGGIALAYSTSSSSAKPSLEYTGRNAGDGWIGRLCDAAFDKEPSPELVVHVGATEPYSLHSRTHPAVVFQTPHSYKWVAPDEDDKEMYRKVGEEAAKDAEKKDGEKKDADKRAADESGTSNPVLRRLRGVLNDANESSLRIRRAVAAYEPRAQYGTDELSETLKVAASLIDARVGSRVISVELGGFDTHYNQRQPHDVCMRKLDAGLGGFLNDIAGTSAGDEVVVVCFSEFGRRVKENGSRGTDHGVAAPMLVFGSKIKGGLYGKHPSLTELDDGDLVMTTDFRSVYGTVIERWFGTEQTKVLDAKYPALDFLKA